MFSKNNGFAWIGFSVLWVTLVLVLTLVFATMNQEIKTKRKRVVIRVDTLYVKHIYLNGKIIH